MKLHATYLCERNALVREGIKGFLSGSRFKIVGEYGDLAEIFQEGNAAAPDLIIIGIDRGQGSDAQPQRYQDLFEQIACVRKQFPVARLVLLMASDESSGIRDALCWAVDSCILRETSQDAFLNYLNLAMIGEKVLPASILTPLLEESRERNIIPLRAPGVLSERERDIIRCLIRGDSNKKIAHRLMIAEATVKAHLKAILRKLGASNRTQAALWGVSQGLDVAPAEEHEPAA